MFLGSLAWWCLVNSVVDCALLVGLELYCGLVCGRLRWWLDLVGCGPFLGFGLVISLVFYVVAGCSSFV